MFSDKSCYCPTRVAKKYSDKFKAQALAVLQSCKGNFSHAARELRIPRITLKNWAAGQMSDDSKADIPAQRRDMAAALEDIAWKLISAMPEKIPAAPLTQVATALGISLDKMRLLRGEATSISDNRSQLDRLVAELAAKYSKSVEEIRADLVKIRPETSLYLVEAEKAPMAKAS